MNKYLLVLFFMIFMHIIADYNLQGVLANMKQKSWWEERTSEPIYKYDYIAALICHGFQWSVCIHIPVLIYLYLISSSLSINLDEELWAIVISIAGHALLHSYIDSLKANRKAINLITDQILHLLQIIMGIWIPLSIM